MVVVGICVGAGDGELLIGMHESQRTGQTDANTLTLHSRIEVLQKSGSLSLCWHLVGSLVGIDVAPEVDPVVGSEVGWVVSAVIGLVELQKPALLVCWAVGRAVG